MASLQIAKLGWRDDALQLLKSVLHDADGFSASEFVRNGVQSGSMEMWNLGNKATAITQTSGDCLHVHAYEGRDVLSFAKVFSELGRRSGCSRATFNTDNKGLLRMLKDYNPKSIGENLYEVRL
jgi:hypothetical protein